jgi:hypothetical protein
MKKSERYHDPYPLNHSLLSEVPTRQRVWEGILCGFLRRIASILVR